MSSMPLLLLSIVWLFLPLIIVVTDYPIDYGRFTDFPPYKELVLVGFCIVFNIGPAHVSYLG